MFPELSCPLTSEQLVEKIQKKENPDYCFHCLFEILMPLIKYIAKPYLPYIPLYDMDDMIQEGRILIWKVVYKYNPDMNVSFDSFFGSCYKYRCNKLYRSNAHVIPCSLPNDCTFSKKGFQIYVHTPRTKKHLPKGYDAAVSNTKKNKPDVVDRNRNANAADKTRYETQILSPEQQAQKIMKLQKRRERRWINQPISVETQKYL